MCYSITRKVHNEITKGADIFKELEKAKRVLRGTKRQIVMLKAMMMEMNMSIHEAYEHRMFFNVRPEEHNLTRPDYIRKRNK